MSTGDSVDVVQGERGATEVSRSPSLQSRISSLLAVGLMSVLGVGLLTWYYANAMTRSTREKQSARSASVQRAQGDMPLPGLGRIDPPPRSIEPPPALLPTPLLEIPLAPSPPQATQSLTPTGAGVSPPPKSASQLLLDRQLSGAVFVPRAAAMASIDAPSPVNGTATDAGELTALLRPSVTATVRAQVLPTQRLLLPKGAFIDCTLETAIDSTLPGMTTCVMATDTFGVDGKVVLLERGTKLVGETRGQVQQGSARVFVLWSEARTPTGVIVPLASPGTDELGRSGLPGAVDRHFWERFGAAMLVSVIDGAVQAAVQSTRGNGGAVVVNPSSNQDVLTEVLKGTINIAPTVVKQQGDRIQVLVARDLDFRSVYELRSASR